MFSAQTIWVLTTNFFEGLPFYLIRQVSAVYFKDQGASLQAIGIASLLGLPWTLKFLWSPWVDSVATKRIWVLGTQMSLALFGFLLAWAVGTGASLQVVAGLFVFGAFLAATQDMAVDGFYLQALSPPDQARYVGPRIAAYRVAMLVGSGVLVGLSDQNTSSWFSWSTSFSVFGLICCALVGLHFFVLPRPREGSSTEKAQMKFFDAFRSYARMPKFPYLVAFAVLFKIGDALMFAMSTPFLLDAGVTKAQLAIIGGTFGVLASIGGSMIAGQLIAKRGIEATVWPIALCQNGSIVLYAIAAALRPGIWGLGIIHVWEQFAAGLGAALYYSFLMRHTSAEHKASHFAISTTFMALSTMLCGVVSGFVAQRLGYTWLFSLSVAAGLPGMMLIPALQRKSRDEVVST